MGKYKLVALTSLMALSLFGCTVETTTEEPKVKIGVIDTNRVFEESEAGKQGLERLTKMQDEVQKELEEMQKTFEANPEDADAMMKMQQAYQMYQVRFNAEQQSLVGVLDAALIKSIDNVKNKQGYDLVFAKDSALASSDRLDITSAVIEDLNAQKVELPPVQPKTTMPTMPAIPEAAAPADEEEQPQGMHGY